MNKEHIDKIVEIVNAEFDKRKDDGMLLPYEFFDCLETALSGLELEQWIDEPLKVGDAVIALPQQLYNQWNAAERNFNKLALVNKIYGNSVWLTFEHGGQFLWPIGWIQRVKLSKQPLPSPPKT